MMKNERARTLTVVAAFLLAAMWFFVPVGKPEGTSLLFSLRLALPAAVLALGGIGLVPMPMTIGFCFCAIGDAMGVIGSFEGQMGGFAVAHVCFICFFLREVRRSAVRPLLLAATTLFCLLPLTFAALKVLPAIQNQPIRIGCSVYALLLTGTVWSSIVRESSASSEGIGIPFIAATGSVAFLVSDFILAWNKFVEGVPHASLLIMITYYTALLCLFLGTKRTRHDASRK